MELSDLVKGKIETLITELQNGEKKIYYCSFAEIAEKNMVVNMRIALAFKSFKNNGDSSHINTMIDLINQLGYLVSSELLGFLIYMLIDCNEFYYVGLLYKKIEKYFNDGNFGLVPILDRPYITFAQNINKKNVNNMMNAYKKAYYTDVFEDLKNFVLTTGCGTVQQNALHKTKEEIKNQLKIFLIKIIKTKEGKEKWEDMIAITLKK